MLIKAFGKKGMKPIIFKVKKRRVVVKGGV